MDELEISGKRYISTRLAAKEHKYHADYIGQLIRAKKILGQKVGRSWYVEEKSLAEYFGKEASLREMPIEVVAQVPEPAAPRVQPVPEVRAVATDVIQPAPMTQSTASDLIIAAAKILEAARVSTTVSAPPDVAEEKIAVHAQHQELAEEVEVEIKEEEPDVEEQPSVRDSIHIPIRLTRPSFTITKKPAGLRYIDDEAVPLPEVKKNRSARIKTAITSASQTDNTDTGEVYITQFAAKEGSAGILIPVVSIAMLGIVAFAVVALSSVLVDSNMLIQAGKTASAWYSLH